MRASEACSEPGFGEVAGAGAAAIGVAGGGPEGARSDVPQRRQYFVAEEFSWPHLGQTGTGLSWGGKATPESSTSGILRVVSFDSEEHLERNYRIYGGARKLGRSSSALNPIVAPANAIRASSAPVPTPELSPDGDRLREACGRVGHRGSWPRSFDGVHPGCPPARPGGMGQGAEFGVARYTRLGWI